MTSSSTDDEQLQAISERTIGHYEQTAASFWLGTCDHDTSQNIGTLLHYIEASTPCRILDLGCGPGRDLLHFQKAGHIATGLDGSKVFCKMARDWSGCEVLHQSFLTLKLPSNEYHGIFANASLFHVPQSALDRVLLELHQTLAAEGVLLVSNPRGENQARWNGDRYGVYHTKDAWVERVAGAGFELLEHYYRPQGKPRHQQPWLVTVWRKSG